MCLNPRTIKCADGVHTMEVKCGHCLQCVREYQQTWVSRLSEEYKSWRNVLVSSYDPLVIESLQGAPPIVFFTLTYGENCIPKNFLHLTTTGVHFAKAPLFDLPVSHWNTTLKESERDAKIRQENIEREFKSDLQVYLDTFGDDTDCGAFEQDTYDLPAWMFDEQSRSIGRPISNIVSFNSVRYSDVRNWLKSCRVKYSRKLPPVVLANGRKCNPRYVSEIDGMPLPPSALTTSFKYFICSEYGPRTLRPH